MSTILYKANSRGKADYGWLKANYSFSFANYYDPSRIHFGMLRVLNDDTVAPMNGFDTHPHDNMEIITIPLQGEITHRDSMGFGETLKAGQIQVMSAGTGIFHSEHNNHPETELKLLQIWVFPHTKNVKPRYDTIDYELIENKLVQLVSPYKEDEGSWIHQNAWFNLGKFTAGKQLAYSLHDQSNGIFVFIIKGKVKINDTNIETRDAMGISNQRITDIECIDDSEILIIEVPMN